MSSSFLFLLILLVFLLTYCSSSQIPLGSQLTASGSQSWVSQNRTFAFGFVQVDSRSQKFVLAIWYADLPGETTIVWSPNRDSPVSPNAVVVLDQSGNLALTDRNNLIWSSNTTRLNVDFAVMSDSGSFILYNGTSTDRQVAWQSFWLPADTLLPGQLLTASLELISNRSKFGYYTLKMLQQHTSLSLALSFVTFDSQANYSYWSSPQISNATGNIVAVLDNSGSFSITYGESLSGTVYIHKNDTTSTNPGNNVVRRIKVETDGNLRLYEWNTSTIQWDVKWAAVSNPCEVAGICGSGICNLDGSGVDASCTDLPETNSGNCRENFKMQTVPQTDYYFLGPSTISNFSNITVSTDCSKYCLSDCDCVAAVYGLVEEITYCWTLRSMVFGGLQDPSSTLFVKVANDGSSSSGNGGGSENGRSNGDQDKRDRAILLPLLLCVSALVVLLGMLFCYGVRKRRIRHKPGMMIGKALSFPGAPMYFSYHHLQAATANFSRLIGTGGFGSVYKGTLKDGTVIAVKKLERFLPHGEKEFVTEVTTIGSMHHMNLVTLCGFCSEKTHRLLVYEYMSNGSLDKWIFPSYSRPDDRILDWPTRFQIAIAIAQGIAYFHEQCKNRIIHCDIKPENILLDENFCPKVSDFGLAKLMSREHSHVVTMVRGTRGYLAPEWVSNRPITVKADVYSYGMLLLEIVGGRRNLDMSFDSEEFFYPGWAFKELTNGTPMKAADRRLQSNVEEDELLMTLNTAFWCIQEEAWVRPSMGEVVRMLEGSVEINMPPMPQTVVELHEEGMHSVYMAMKRSDPSMFPINDSSTLIYSQRSSQLASQATCSYSTMSPR